MITALAGSHNVIGYEDQWMLGPAGHTLAHCRSPEKNTYTRTQLAHHTNRAMIKNEIDSCRDGDIHLLFLSVDEAEQVF